MSPPTAEGFSISTGGAAACDPTHALCLSAFFRRRYESDAARLRPRTEQRIQHDDWLAWTRQFGDWLLTQQTAEGAFPRSWKPVSGEVFDASPQSTYNLIPFLVLPGPGDARHALFARGGTRCRLRLEQRTEEQAVRGGTIDNPDVPDKDAGTLSIEAYLALYGSIKDAKWLKRARAAADYAETWIYLWKVPMPANADDRRLHWKKGVATTGTQLIAMDIRWWTTACLSTWMNMRSWAAGPATVTI